MLVQEWVEGAGSSECIVLVGTSCIGYWHIRHSCGAVVCTGHVVGCTV